MSIISRNAITWPKRILYGIGGFLMVQMGGNITYKLTEATMAFIGMWEFGVLVGIALVVALYKWCWDNVKHESTRTGILVSIWWQLILLVLIILAQVK